MVGPDCVQDVNVMSFETLFLLLQKKKKKKFL